MKKFGFLLLVTGLVSHGGGMAQDEAPTKIDLGGADVIVVDDTVIPLPLEIFASLDKLGKQDWGDTLENRDVRRFPDRSRSALLFGLVVSDGFIAVQAKDREAVKRIGRDVLNLSNVLGVNNEVAGHANAVMMEADKGEWSNVRMELDRTRQTVLDQMRKNRDEEMANLVSLGGWLGGTKALAQILRVNYTAEGSDLLNQPDLVRRLKEDFDKLPVASRRGALFVKVGETLKDLETLMKSNSSGQISAGSVSEISSKTTDLVDAIYES